MHMPEATVTALCKFDKAPTIAALTSAFEEHIWTLFRFSSVVRGNRFVPVEGPMDRSYHFTELQVSKEAEIDAYVQSVMSRPLDHAYPLWTVTVIRATEGKSAVLVRIHHVIGDGLGLLFAFLPLMECDDGDILAKIPLPAGILRQLPLEQRPPAAAPRPDRSQGQRPRRRGCISSFVNQIRMFFRGAFSVLAMKPDSELKFNPPLSDRAPYLPFSGRHVYTRMPPVPVSAIKAVRASQGCTFNDAIMAAIAGAFRRYADEDLQDPLVQAGCRLESKAFMLLGLPRPVDRNSPGKALCNNILTPVFHLPIDKPSAAERLQSSVQMTNALKSAAYVSGIHTTFKVLSSIVPRWIIQGIAGKAISSITCNISNVPLPDVAMRVGGEEAKELQFIFVNNIPQISLVSYNGFLHWNMVSDPELIPDPLAIGRHFLAEFQELKGP